MSGSTECLLVLFNNSATKFLLHRVQSGKIYYRRTNFNTLKFTKNFSILKVLLQKILSLNLINFAHENLLSVFISCLPVQIHTPKICYNLMTL